MLAKSTAASRSEIANTTILSCICSRRRHAVCKSTKQAKSCWLTDKAYYSLWYGLYGQMHMCMSSRIVTIFDHTECRSLDYSNCIQDTEKVEKPNTAYGIAPDGFCLPGDSEKRRIVACDAYIGRLLHYPQQDLDPRGVSSLLQSGRRQ